MAIVRMVGTVTKVDRSRRFCFIERKNLELVRGGSYDLPHGWHSAVKDIYLHQDDCTVPLEKGMKVQFSVERDPQRSGEFRAKDAWGVSTDGAISVRVRRPGVNLHVSQLDIDNPGIPFNWCLSDEMHSRVIEGLRAGKGYAVLLVARKSDDEGGLFEIREVVDTLQPVSILTFPKPGEWTVGAILFERTKPGAGHDTSRVLRDSLRTRYLERSGSGRKKKRSFERMIPSLFEIGFVQNGQPACLWATGNIGEGNSISLAEIAVLVPKEIFAPEPSEAKKAYANYFFSESAYDECEYRRRMLIMLPGVIPWFLAELFKRAMYVFMSIAFGLLLLRGTGRFLSYGLKPAVKIDMEGFSELEGPGNEWRRIGIWNRKHGIWFTPLLLMLYGAALWILVWTWNATASWRSSFVRFVGEHSPVFLAGIASAFLVACIYGAFRLRTYLRKRMSSEKRAEQYRRAEERQEAMELAQRQSAIAAGTARARMVEQHAGYLVCGDAPARVELKALPADLKPMGLRLRAIKRNVCKPFG